jgi:hypothetical protein
VLLKDLIIGMGDGNWGRLQVVATVTPDQFERSEQRRALPQRTHRYHDRRRSQLVEGPLDLGEK